MSSLSLSDKVLILEGSYENFKTSLCKALETDRFLWGFKHKKDYNKVLKRENRDSPVVFYIPEKEGSVIGRCFVKMIAKVGEEVKDKELRELFWPDEIRANKIIYPYRFYLVPVKTSEKLPDICTGAEPPEEIFIKLDDIEKYIEEKCGSKKQIPVGWSANTLQGCEARKLLEYLEQNFTLADFKYTLKNLLGRIRPFRNKSGELKFRGDEVSIILLSLFSGKNVLLVGPPGSGKTSLLRELLDGLGVSYRLVTGNPEWTPFDTIGGMLVGGGVRKGFIFSTIEESVRVFREDGRLHWLILDEINRANVDLAFGKFFTLLDPVYREKEKLEIPGVEGGESSTVVPFSFRVLATMNSYDRAMLFKLGYALTRRFAIISHIYLEDLSTYCNNYVKKASEENTLRELVKYSETIKDLLHVDFEKIREELVKCREVKHGEYTRHDCITPVDFAEKIKGYGDKWVEEVFSLKVSETEIKLDRILLELVEELNSELANYEDCEICPVQITPGVVADALKYIAVGIYAYKQGYGKLECLASTSNDKQTLAYALLLLDTAFSTYILPQLDILADYAHREKLYRGRPGAAGQSEGNSIEDILRSINEKLKKAGLIYSAKLVEKLVKGYHVF